MSEQRTRLLLRRFGLPAVLAVLGTVSLAAGVYAATIKPSQVPTTAAEFDSQSCTGPFEALADGEDGWHFIDAKGDGFTSITLTFTTPDGQLVVGPITSKDEAAPNTGPGWEGFLDDAAGKYKHAYVITTAGWTLTAASAVLVNEKEGAEFNLSHTCAGTPPTDPSPSPSPSASQSVSPSPSTSTSPSTSPSASPSESPSPSPSESPSESPSPSPSESPSESPSPSPSTSESPSPSPSTSESPSTSPSTTPSVSPSPGEELPKTGSDLSGLLIGSGVLLIGGAVLLVVFPRRRLILDIE